MKLALIAAALAGAHAFGEYKDEKKPFAVTIHGAGFRSVLGGGFAEDAFAQLYGPLAKSQADGMEPIVTAFLEGTL